MFGSLGIFQAMVQALKSVIEDLLGTTSDTYASGTLMGRTKTGIKSIQRGTIAVTNETSTTATISSVDTTKSMVTHLGNTGRTSYNDDVAGMLQLTNATTVTLTRIATATTTYSFEVIEFY